MRAISLATDVLVEKLGEPAAVQAAWDDVVDAFESATTDTATLESRVLFLKDVAELRGHEWSAFGGMAEQLSGVLAGSKASAVRAGLLDEGDVDDWHEALDWSEERRRDACRQIVVSDAERGDVVVWVLFAKAYVEAWRVLGPVQLFNAALISEGCPCSTLKGFEGYSSPPELGDWAEAARWLGDLHLPKDEHAVLARVALGDTLIERAPTRARTLLTDLIDVTANRSGWRLIPGTAEFNPVRGWSGSSLRFDSRTEEERNLPVHPVFDSTPDDLMDVSCQFAERLAASDPNAEEAVEDARWVVAVSRIPEAEQRIALGTRALERALSVLTGDEHWAAITTTHLRTPWIRLQCRRLMDEACLATRTGVAKTHGRDSDVYAAANELLMLPVAGKPSMRRWSHRGLRTLEAVCGPLSEQIHEGRLEHRFVREVLTALESPAAGLELLTEHEKLFAVLLARTQRSRNAIIHGQRPSRGTLASIDDFVRIVGRLVAQDSMRSAETGDAPLLELERWRNEYVDVKASLETGQSLFDVWFADAR